MEKWSGLGIYKGLRRKRCGLEKSGKTSYEGRGVEDQWSFSRQKLGERCFKSRSQCSQSGTKCDLAGVYNAHVHTARGWPVGIKRPGYKSQKDGQAENPGHWPVNHTYEAPTMCIALKTEKKSFSCRSQVPGCLAGSPEPSVWQEEAGKAWEGQVRTNSCHYAFQTLPHTLSLAWTADSSRPHCVPDPRPLLLHGLYRLSWKLTFVPFNIFASKLTLPGICIAIFLFVMGHSYMVYHS